MEAAHQLQWMVEMVGLVEQLTFDHSANNADLWERSSHLLHDLAQLNGRYRTFLQLTMYPPNMEKRSMSTEKKQCFD